MRSAALAIGWEFRKRHAWPLIAMLAYLLVLAAIKLLGLGPADAITLVPPDGRGAVLIAPLSTTFMYYLAVFSFGLSGDLASRQSIFPARLFTLPVRTESLVLGPMLHGTATVAIIVQAATLLARWPWGLDAPWVWPALLAAVFLAWTQALTWMPYGLPGIRVVLSVLWLVTLDAIVIAAVHFEASESVMLVLLAPQLPLAYFVARYGVARARRGDVPDWLPRLTRLWRRVDHGPRQRGHFASPAHAHMWLEWRRQGRTLPALMMMLLPVELALLWIARDAPMLAVEIVLIALFTPPLMASFMVMTVSKAHPEARSDNGMSPFIATRPLSSAVLLGAKLKMALWSTLAAWLLVLVAVPLALRLSGTWPMMIERVGRFINVVGSPRAIVFGVIVLVVLIAATWNQLVQSLCIGLTGRDWIARSVLMAALAFIVFLGPLAQWIVDHKSAQALLITSVPTLLALLVALKMIAAAWVAARLTRSGLLRDRTLVAGAVTWVALVFALFSILVWLFAVPLIPRYFLALVAILLVPLARVSAAPLALAWNRHR